MTEPFHLVPHLPEACAAFGEAGERSASELLSDVGSLAAALPESDPASEILIICRDRYHFAVGLLAAWQRGHSAALPPNGAPETVRALSRKGGVKLLLHDVDAGEGFDLRPLLGRATAPSPLSPIAPERRIATLYTSGSTGDHQACPKLASQLLGEARSHTGTFALAAGTRIVSTVPGHHIYGLLYSVLAPLLGGAAFSRETPLHAETVRAVLERDRADVLVSVPAHLRGLEALSSLPPLRFAFSSGAPLPAATAAALRARFGLKVTEVYGSSETGGIAWRDDPQADWTPFAGVKISTSPDGRLLVDSPYVVADQPGPFACADRATRSPDGRFRLMGRFDGVVKVGGKRVSLAEVEQRLASLPGVRDVAACAVDVPGARGQEIWVAVAASEWTAERLRTALLQWFEPVALPRRVLVVERLPREENGKMTRRALRALFDDPHSREKPFVKSLEPTREEQRSEGGADVRVLEFPVREDLLYLRGHFDGWPILPGVAQLHGLVLRQSRRAWPDLGVLRKVRKLQFKRLIQPHQLIALRLTRTPGSTTVEFQITREGLPCSSGTFIFEG